MAGKLNPVTTILDPKDKIPEHEVVKLWNKIEGADGDRIEESIRVNGVWEPVKLWVDGKGKTWLIDGRHRREWAGKHGKELPAQFFEGDQIDVLEYAKDLNYNRRQLNSSQIAAYVIRSGALHRRYAEKAAKGKRTSPNLPLQQPPANGEALPTEGETLPTEGAVPTEGQAPDVPPSAFLPGGSEKDLQGDQAQQLADRSGTSRPYIHKAARIFENRPELLDKVMANEMTIDQAYKAMKGEAEAGGAAAPQTPAAGDAAAEVVKDGNGAEVPKKLLEAFATRDAFKEAIRLVNKAVVTVNTIREEKAANFTHGADAVAHLRNGVSEIKAAMPFAVCPTCKGEKKLPAEDGKTQKCTACEAKGWVTKPVYSALTNNKEDKPEADETPNANTGKRSQKRTGKRGKWRRGKGKADGGDGANGAATADQPTEPAGAAS